MVFNPAGASCGATWIADFSFTCTARECLLLCATRLKLQTASTQRSSSVFFIDSLLRDSEPFPSAQQYPPELAVGQVNFRLNSGGFSHLLVSSCAAGCSPPRWQHV